MTFDDILAKVEQEFQVIFIEAQWFHFADGVGPAVDEELQREITTRIAELKREERLQHITDPVPDRLAPRPWVP